MNDKLEKVSDTVKDLNDELDQTAPDIDSAGRAANRAGKQTRGWLKEVVSVNRTLKQATALVGAAFGLEKIAAWSGEAIAAEQAVSNAFGLTGNQLQSVTAEVQKMSDVFGSDVNSTIESTRSLMNNFGLSAEQSLALMRTGLEKGVSAESLNNISALAPKFEQAGLSAESFFSKMIMADRLGVAKELESGLDSASKVLEDLGKNKDAQAALAALGFNPKAIQKGLKDGTLSVAQAVEQISTKITAFDTDQQKAAAAMSAVFGESSKNMQMAIGILDEEGPTALSEIKNRTTDAAAAQQNLLGAWSDLKNLLTSSIVPVFSGIIDWVYANQQAIKTWGLAIASVGAAFLGVWAAAKTVMGIKAMVATITSAWTVLTNAMNLAKVAQIAFNVAASLNPLGLVVTAIAAVGAAVYGLVTYWDEVASFLVDMGSMLMSLNPLSWLIDALGWLFPSFADAWEGFATHFTEYAQKAWDGFTSFFTDPFEDWVGWFQGWWDWFTGEAAPQINATTEKGTALKLGEMWAEATQVPAAEPTATSALTEATQKTTVPKITGTAQFVGNSKDLGVSQAMGSVAGDSRQAKNITISIQKLIETFVVQSTTVSESNEKVKDAVLQALMAAVNDANTI